MSKIETNTNVSAKNTESKVGFVSLGCPKALVDSERILSQLKAEGYRIVDHYNSADVVVVNTCGFINEAVEESMDAIGEALAENGKVIVTGCLGAKADDIRARYPNVLHVSGPQQYESVIEAVHTHLPPQHDPYTSLLPPGGLKLTPRHYAYLKISEGCNHRCTFCIIPSMRGKLVSRPIHHVVHEAEQLVKAGVKELLVISQDTSAYGIDRHYSTETFRDRTLKTRFFELAQELGQLDAWVRLHYVYPYPHVDEVIPLMAEGLIVPYLDIPFQHASPRILKLMKRPACTENNLERIRSWREICPEITLRSTFIVGFPGETEQEFEELLDFMTEAQLDRVGCFAYSPVEGAQANELPDAVPEEVKQERLARFMAHQSHISAARLEAKVGLEMPVLIDQVFPEGIIARTTADAPEIDGCVHLPPEPNLKPGQFIDVEIIDSDEHDLWGAYL